MFTRRSCLKDREQKTRFLEGGGDGKGDEVHEEESLRAEGGREPLFGTFTGVRNRGVWRGSVHESECMVGQSVCVCIRVRALVC